MAPHQKRAGDEPVGERRRRTRRLIAGLRISPEEEALLAVVRPYLTDLSSEGEFAYRLWRRGLELALAEAVSIGARLPPDTHEQFIAGLVAQRLLLCVPLLRRTGTLSLLGLTVPVPLVEPAPAAHAGVAMEAEAIDEGAADAITGLGGTEFL